MKFDYVPDDAAAGDRAAARAAHRRPQGAGPRLDDGGRGRAADRRSWSVHRRANAFVIVAPRKPERFELVAALLEDVASKLPVQCRPERDSPATATGTGRRAAARHLRRAGAASIASPPRRSSAAAWCRLGGHNPIEPAAAGVPVCFGPYMSNFREIARDLPARRRRRSRCATRGERDRVRRADVRRRARSAHGRARAAGRCEQNRGAAARTARADRRAAGVNAAPASRSSCCGAASTALRRALYRARHPEGEAPAAAGDLGRATSPRGGAGKTPAVIAIARFLDSARLTVAVLTRGYGRAGAGGRGHVARRGDVRRRAGADQSKRHKCGRNRRLRSDIEMRYESLTNDAMYSCSTTASSICSSHRDVDVVIDAPSRWYREGRSALRDADFVIPRRLRLDRPGALRGKRVFAFAGLADNEQFFDALRATARTSPARAASATTTATPQRRLAAIEAAADADADVIVTTEKDAVKIDDRDIIADRRGDSSHRAIRESSLEADQHAERVRAIAPTLASKRRKNALLQRVEYAAYRAVARALSAPRSDEARSVRWGTRLGALGAPRPARPRPAGHAQSRARLSRKRATPSCGASSTNAGATSAARRSATSRCSTCRSRRSPTHCPFVERALLDEALARGRGVAPHQRPLRRRGRSAGWRSWRSCEERPHGGAAARQRAPRARPRAHPRAHRRRGRRPPARRARAATRRWPRRRAVVLLPDQAVQPREGILVPFLGRPAWTTDAPAKLALRHGSTIVFGFCIPDGPRHDWSSRSRSGSIN